MARAAKTWGKLHAKPGQRANAYRRGYDRKWQRLAEAYKQANPLCVDCLEAGRVRPSEEVHHVQKVTEHPERRLDWDNLMALCAVCHATRTAKGE